MMKAKISPTIFPVVLTGLYFVVSIASAGGVFDDWAYAINSGNVPVILHIKTGENKYAEIQLEPGKAIILPAGSQKVTAFPAKGRLDEADSMKVDTNLFTEDFRGGGRSITEPGKSVKFPRPSVAVTPEMRKDMKDDVVFAPGALAPVEETKEKAPIDDKEFLHEQNKMYMDKRKRLEEIDPNGSEAEVIRGALKIWKKDLERMTEQAEAKYGSDWKEQYRDSSGKLPGGFIEDNKSRFIKLQERCREQRDKVEGLKSEFEELKKQLKPVESKWEDRLSKDQREFRNKFVAEHGPPSSWDDETRKQYEKGFNNLMEKSRKQWERDRAEQAEVNRAIGKKIKEIAQEQAELNMLDEKARRLETRQKAEDAKQPTDEKTEAKKGDVEQKDDDEDLGYYITVSKPDKRKQLGWQIAYFESDVPKNGIWNGWAGITIKDGKGTYNDTYGTGPGRFTFWRNEEGHYSGSWGESEQRFGTLEFKCAKDGTEIKGSWRASDKCSIAPGDSGDIHWTFASPVPESSEDNQFTLRVITVTADNELADMDGGLHAYIMVNGQDSLKQELDDPEDDFEPGATDTFERTFNIPLSEVKSISLVVDGDDEWLCELISFQFFTKNKMSRPYAFDIETWFSGESKDMDELGAVKSKTFGINPSADGLIKKK